MSRFAAMLVGVFAVALVFLPQPAQAEMGNVLGEIQWGDSKDDVLQKLRSEKLGELRESSRLRNDQAAMQRARQGVLDEMRRIEDTYTELKDGAREYAVSVIAGEFTPDNNESFLRVRDDVANRYYFFLNGEFYKLVIAYDQNHVRNMGFGAFKNQVQQRYGQPVSTERGRSGGEETVVQATWEDGQVQMRIHDRKDFFGTFTMVFSDQQTVEHLQAQNAEFGGGDDHTEVSQRVQAVTRTSGERRNQNVVDDLVGGELEEIDLPERPSERRAREEAKEAEKERAEEERRRASQPTRTERPSRPAQPAATTSDDDDGDDLVIY